MDAVRSLEERLLQVGVPGVESLAWKARWIGFHAGLGVREECLD